jgi:S-formylglutathione hydrolase FrmB
MWLKLVDDLMGKGEQAVLAVVDGTDRFGCSQYVNSAATGRYLDYICDEVVPTIEKSEYCGGSAKLRIVAGHSSGGFGALRLGMARQKMFGGVVALSPDSYFDVTHKPFTTEPAVSAIKISQVEAVGKPPFEAKADSLGDDGSYVFNLCADYASNQDGSIPWIYDSKGSYREGIYDRWLEADPAVRAGRGHPFARNQRVYLDGAAQDDFKANLGAAKVAENLKGKVDNMTLYFPPGHHSDHLEERLLRGIGWIFGAPTFDIK